MHEHDNDSDSDAAKGLSPGLPPWDAKTPGMHYIVSAGFSDLRGELREFRSEISRFASAHERTSAAMESSLDTVLTGVNELRATSTGMEKILTRIADQEDTRLRLEERELALREREARRAVEREEASQKAEQELQISEAESKREFRRYVLDLAQIPPVAGVLQGIGLLFSVYLAGQLGFGQDLVRYTLGAVLGVHGVAP